jgi:hypothetical protein
MEQAEILLDAKKLINRRGTVGPRLSFEGRNTKKKEIRNMSGEIERK